MDSIREWAANQSWREVTYLPLSNPHLAAAAFVATLVYPESTAKRERFIDALVDAAFRGMRAADRAHARASRTRAPMRRRDVYVALRKAQTRLGVRMRANDMAAKIEVEKVAGKSPLPIEGARSLRDAIAHESSGIVITLASREPAPDWLPLREPRPPRPGAEVDTNVIRDVWTPSKPVLPLSAALYPALTNFLRAGREVSVESLVHEPAWVCDAVKSVPFCAYSLVLCEVATAGELVMLLPAESAQN